MVGSFEEDDGNVDDGDDDENCLPQPHRRKGKGRARAEHLCAFREACSVPVCLHPKSLTMCIVVRLSVLSVVVLSVPLYPVDAFCCNAA